MRRMWIWAVVVLFIACGGNDRPKSLPADGAAAANGIQGASGATAAGGRAATGSTGGAGEQGGEGGDSEGNSDPDGPLVRITSPAEVLHPDQGELLIADEVAVLCEVSPATSADSAPVNAASIEISMLEPNGKVTKRPGVSSGIPGEFTARFIVSSVPSGTVSFRCTASDKGAPVRSSQHQVSTFVDHGPLIAPEIPIADAAYALLGALDFQFSVAAVPLSADDAGSAVGGVTLEVDGVPIAIIEDAKKPGFFTATVDFSDATLFEEVPTGQVPVSIRATNSRKPTAAEEVQNYSFTLDADGPVIAISKPRNNEVIGDELIMVFTVKDVGAGIDPESVTVRLNGTEYRYDAASPLWLHNNDTFSFSFDSTKIKNAVSQVTVNINADDRVGNQAKGESLFLYIDNMPPLVSLDTSPVRVITYSGTTGTCSVSFDPLGDAANDGQMMNRFGRLRAFIWDQTNGTDSQDVFYLAGVDPDQAYLYLQPDPLRPLLVDLNGDQICDEVDNDGGKIPFQHLDAVATGGKLWYGADDSPALPLPPSDCLFRNEAKPDALCLDDVSDLLYVIRQFNSGQSKAPAAIYAPAVSAADTFTCTGSQWDISSVALREGWVCLAARALDGVGNVGISRPLRLCVDDETTPSRPDCSAASMPDCTDGCLPPAKPPAFLIAYH